MKDSWWVDLEREVADASVIVCTGNHASQLQFRENILMGWHIAVSNSKGTRLIISQNHVSAKEIWCGSET